MKKIKTLTVFAFVVFVTCTKTAVVGRSIVAYPFTITQNELWKTEYKDDVVLIQSKTIEYENSSDGIKHERVIFKYTNLTNQTISISFNRNLFYNGKCYGCEQPERKYTIQLNALETKAYSDKNKSQEYYIFSKDLQGFITKTLDSFHIVNLEQK